METVSNQTFPPLESVTRPSVPTEQAAYYLDRKAQTMRAWACLDNGPIRPLRINGRLAWPVKEIKKVLGVEV
ncbi:DNA-binding protein [Nitrosomonas sp.]|uniref:DNA-binding protein n=1 Tax=Nitrosomonas sp. TaxID=42353 RepID=UPI0027319894|nr:DNA-binding protein [Nitrosomonas sp.]MDP2225596.1 DNA-binding protein [Nitrosomonas sp.]